MAHQQLDDSQVGSSFQEVSGKAGAQGMDAPALS